MLVLLNISPILTIQKRVLNEERAKGKRRGSEEMIIFRKEIQRH